ncbi:hypothetical protein [Promicromonospora sukumoe]
MRSSKQIIAATLGEHNDPEGHMPPDEFNCCAEAVVAALADAGMVIVDEGLATALDAGATIVDNHASMLAQLVMDTPKDQELTDRLVELARNSAQNLREAAIRATEGGAA